jgi:hypothetical protein
MKHLLTTLAMLWASTALATSPNDRMIDNIQNLTGGASISVPSVGTTFATDTNTLTLTNKSLSGSANTFTNIPASAISSGQLAVANGGTGDASLTAHNVLLGEGTSPVAFAAPTQYESLIGNASGDPSFQAVPLNQSAAVSGQLGASNGGTGLNGITSHNLIVGNGSSAANLIAPSATTGYVLTSNGSSSDPSFQALPAMAPTINNSAASPQSVTAAGGVSLSAPTYQNVVFIKGNTPASTTVVTATPSITACTAAGQQLNIISESSTALVELQNQADLAGSQLLLNGPWTSGENNSSPYTLHLICDGAATPNWVEVARNN